MLLILVMRVKIVPLLSSVSMSRRSSIPAAATRQLIRLLPAAVFALTLFLYLHHSSRYSVPPEHNELRVELVIASTTNDSTTWFNEFVPQWRTNIYVTDDPNAELTVSKNKGRESTAYLTYIIENYLNLPDVVIFHHGRRYQWHNEDPMYDGAPVLQRFRIPYVLQHGFATLRCSWEYGCPRELHPSLALESRLNDEKSDDRMKTEAEFAAAFETLFPEASLPEVVGVHCGAQFAVTKERILSRSIEDYKRYRQWLWDTPLPDSLSGRIMEYSWHMIMGMPPVACPHAGSCFCQKFGLCDLNCQEHSCEKRYWVKYGPLPENWPIDGPGQDGWPPAGWADL